MPYDPNRGPLRNGQLKELWRSCPTPEVRELLWEIDRLHRVLDDIILTLRHLLATYERCSGQEDVVTQTLRPAVEALKREPAYAIAEFRRKRMERVQIKPKLQGPEPPPPP